MSIIIGTLGHKKLDSGCLKTLSNSLPTIVCMPYICLDITSVAYFLGTANLTTTKMISRRKSL